MAEKVSQPSDDEITRLKARVAELEAEVQKKNSKADGRESARSVTSNLSDTTFRKADVTMRMFRGMTFAALESFSLFADSLSSVAAGVISRGSSSDEKSLRDLASRVPGDVASSFADAIDQMTQIPGKAADRYASAYRQGEGSKAR
jgi:hypothetical protein